jgi:hypothetical protein
MNHPCISGSQVKRAVISNAAGDLTVVAAVTGRKIRVLQFYIRQSAAGTLRFESGTSGTALTGVMVTTTADLVCEGSLNPFGHFETAAGTLLNLEIGTGAAMGWLTYQEV